MSGNVKSHTPKFLQLLLDFYPRRFYTTLVWREMDWETRISTPITMERRIERISIV